MDSDEMVVEVEQLEDALWQAIEGCEGHVVEHALLRVAAALIVDSAISLPFAEHGARNFSKSLTALVDDYWRTKASAEQ